MSEHKGMMPREQWEKTKVAQASVYSCAKCGKRFDSPQEVYDHLDAEHPPKRPPRARRSAA
jgi:ribosome-binding protein aMBF1 (putative translation factor)